MINLILITHEQLAESLLATALAITGAEEAGIKLLHKTARTDAAALSAEIQNAIKENTAGTIILADLFGGSCANTCALCTDKNAVLLTGVNLNMLLSFLHNRAKLPLEALAQKIEEDGKKGIVNMNCLLSGGQK